MTEVGETRLTIKLSTDELKRIEDFRFTYRMPNRTAAARELLRRGLLAAESDKHQ
jgi:hypothetical protein